MNDWCFRTDVSSVECDIALAEEALQGRFIMNLDFDGKLIETPLCRSAGSHRYNVTLTSMPDFQRTFEYRIRCDDHPTTSKINPSQFVSPYLVRSLAQRRATLRVMQQRDTDDSLTIVAETLPFPLIDLATNKISSSSEKKISFMLFCSFAKQDSHKRVGSIQLSVSMVLLSDITRGLRRRLKGLADEIVSYETKLQHILHEKKMQHKQYRMNNQSYRSSYDAVADASDLTAVQTTTEDVDEAIVRTRDILTERELTLAKECEGSRLRCDSLAQQLHSRKMEAKNIGSQHSIEKYECKLQTTKLMEGEAQLNACLQSMRCHMKSLHESHSSFLRCLAPIFAKDSDVNVAQSPSALPSIKSLNERDDEVHESVDPDRSENMLSNQQAVALGELGELATWAAGALDKDALLYREALCHLNDLSLIYCE